MKQDVVDLLYHAGFMIIIVASVLNLLMEVVREMKIISSPEKNVNLVVVEKVSHEKY